jgi:hypothetical protein
MCWVPLACDVFGEINSTAHIAFQWAAFPRRLKSGGPLPPFMDGTGAGHEVGKPRVYGFPTS